jgi:hypothetical protein
MVTIMFSQSIGLTALMFVSEKKNGQLERNSVAGVTTIELMLANVSSKIAVTVIQITLILIIAEFVFNVNIFIICLLNLINLKHLFLFKIHINGSVFIVFILLLLQGFCGMSYGNSLGL